MFVAHKVGSTRGIDGIVMLISEGDAGDLLDGLRDDGANNLDRLRVFLKDCRIGGRTPSSPQIFALLPTDCNSTMSVQKSRLALKRAASNGLWGRQVESCLESHARLMRLEGLGAAANKNRVAYNPMQAIGCCTVRGSDLHTWKVCSTVDVLFLFALLSAEDERSGLCCTRNDSSSVPLRERCTRSGLKMCRVPVKSPC